MTLDFDSIESHPSFLYGDDNMIVMLSAKPIAAGHLQIFPREHFTIIEEVPNQLVGELFNTANTLSTVLFENINCQGTNIIVNNGIPAGQDVNRVSVEIIPRQQNDSLNLLWQPQTFSEDQLSTISLKLGEYGNKIMIEEEKPAPLTVSDENQEIKQEGGAENLKLKQFRRIP